MKKKAFTMAEVVLTLGIIGIVAAITVPALNQARPNQEMIMLKKAYHNTARVISELINDDDLYPERDGDCPEGQSVCDGFANISIADMTDGTQEAVYNGKSYSGASKFCGLFAAKMGVSNPSCDAKISVANGGNFTTSDGIVWSVPVGDFSEGSQMITLDVNGLNKGNNCDVDGIMSLGFGQQTAVPIGGTCGGKAPDQFGFRINRLGDLAAVGRVANLYLETEKVGKKYEQFKKELDSGTFAFSEKDIELINDKTKQDKLTD